MIEEWKSVTVGDFGKAYLVSNMGRIFSLHSNRVLQPKRSKGYLRITLCNGSSKRTLSIHRLVALAFVPNPFGKPTVNHLDERKDNNVTTNLEWATVAEQNTYGTRVSRARSHTDYKKRRIDYKTVAEKHDYSNLKMCNRKNVIVRKGSEEILFKSLKLAAAYLGANYGNLSAIANGKRPQKKEYTVCYG